MSEAQRTPTPGRPWHLWLIGITGALWSSMGLVSFMLTQMKVEAAMSRFPPQQRAAMCRHSGSLPERHARLPGRLS
jgi:hypothetical protein